MVMSSAAVAMADSSSRCWDSLPEEILGCIVERLTVMDIAPFSAVCTSWAQAAPPRNKGRYRPLAPSTPYLLLPGEDGDQSDYCALQTFPEGRCYRLGPLPELRGKWFVGCQDGWLVLTDEFSNPSILNPLTGSHIRLPHVTTLPFVEPVFDPSDGSLSEYRYREPHDNEVDCYPLDYFRGNAFKKIIFSTNPGSKGTGNYAALAIFGWGDRVLIFRPSEDKWTLVEGVPGIRDAIYDRRSGRFLAVCLNGIVYEIDPSTATRVATLVGVAFKSSGQSYLAFNLSGDLVQISRWSSRIDLEMHGKTYQTYEVEVKRLDPRTKTWVDIQSLDDCSLFLGNCYSLAIPAQDMPGLKANHIYFTDNDWYILGSDILPKMFRDVGVYSVKDATFMPWYPKDSRLTWPWPAWITPSMKLFLKFLIHFWIRAFQANWSEGFSYGKICGDSR